MAVASFCSIGHSNRPLADFVDMLREAQVDFLVDVRSFPKSRANPLYDTDSLPDDLQKVQIGYRHMPDLGGRRPRQPGVEEDLNGFWRVRSFHNYADYALGAAFSEALRSLIDLGASRRVAMMCSEAVWWRCHRRIIADHLMLRGHRVDHLMAPGRITPATPTKGAVLDAHENVIYPAGPAEPK